MIRAEMADIAREQRSTSDRPEAPESSRPRHLGEFMRPARPARSAVSPAPDVRGQVYRFGG